MYALITGASSGIGLELAHVFAKRGHSLILVARSIEVLEQLKANLEKKFGIKVFSLKADLSEKDSAQKVFDDVTKLGLDVSFLVNNAGFGLLGPFSQTDWQKESQMIQLNITTLTQLTKLFLPSMIHNRFGKVLNVASTAAFQPGPYMTIYYATKAYVLHFSEAINSELSGTGVTVTALCPGPTLSGFQKAASMEGSKLFKILRPATSSEVAVYGYNAMMKGRALAIPGFLNWFTAFTVRLMPRQLVTRLLHFIQKRI